jgi:RNA polymerase sigma factor (sigma-70 family)
MTNTELLLQIRSGNNKAALAELYKAFPSVRHFIKTHGGDEDEARDVFQESLLVFYRNALKPEFTLTSSLNTYLYAICKYQWKDELKKKNRKVNFEVNDTPDELFDYEQEELKDKWLEQVLLALGDKCRDILQLFYYRKKSMEEIAIELGYKGVDSVKTQKYKCLERAKEMAAQGSTKLVSGML